MKIYFVIALILLSACAAIRRTPRVESESRSGLTHEQIKKVLENNMSVFNSCYEKSLSLDATLEGKMVLDWNVVTGGKVESAKVNDAKSEIIDPKMRDCMVQKLATLNFPEPYNTSSVAVSFPFFFKDNKQ